MAPRLSQTPASTAIAGQCGVSTVWANGLRPGKTSRKRKPGSPQSVLVQLAEANFVFWMCLLSNKMMNLKCCDILKLYETSARDHFIEF
jgi:hypothetical protein